MVLVDAGPPPMQPSPPLRSTLTLGLRLGIAAEPRKPGGQRRLFRRANRRDKSMNAGWCADGETGVGLRGGW